MPLSKQGETKAEAELPSAERLALWAEANVGRRGPAPVHLWDPPVCGSIDMFIDRDGIWHHEGRRIGRDALVRLFAGILRREADGSYALVTPAEKLAIRVADVPFLAVDLDIDLGTGRLSFLTNLGEIVPLDADHPLRLGGGEDGAFIPYLTVRRGLEARLTRAAAASFAEWIEQREGKLGVESGGQFFVIGTAEAVS